MLLQKLVSVDSKNSEYDPQGCLVALYLNLTGHSPAYTIWYPSAFIKSLSQMSCVTVMLHPESCDQWECHFYHFPALPVTTLPTVWGSSKTTPWRKHLFLPNTANHNGSAEHLGRWLSSCPTCPANAKLNKKRYYWPHIRSLKLLTTPPTASTLPTAICSTGLIGFCWFHCFLLSQ